MVRVFTSSAIRKQLQAFELTALVGDFKAYKQDELHIATFGRDVAYDHPNTSPLIKAERVFHIHLLPADKVWPNFFTQYQKTSDIHLVYCKAGLDDNCFFLIAILQPDAHKLATQSSSMKKIGVIAEKFRLKY